MPTEKEMLKQLRNGELSLPPLSFCFLPSEPRAGIDSRPDALVEVSWGRIKAKFVLECKSLSTPKAVQDGINRLNALRLPQGYNRMLFVPFLNEQQLLELEKDGISGIDLCGNGVVISPGRFAIFRSGGENRFTSSAPIKNIYRRNSSMVGRVFLSRSVYETVQDVCAEINRRNLLVERWDKTPMSLSTVSKALKALQEDLIITREGSIRLLQPDKLLQKLSDNYVSPNIKARLRLKVSGGMETITRLLREASQTLGLPVMAAGTSSVGRYAVMQRDALFSIYCPRLDTLLERVPGSQSDRFPNLEFMETDDETVFFDSRYEGDFWWASPVQVYLELKAGDKRDQETAEQLRSYIINNLNPVH